MSVALASSPTSNSTQQEPLRVMVVDDSVVIRGLISRWVGSEPDMVVAASLRTGLDAVNQIERVNPDVAVLDIEMPELDGISALPLLLAKKRNLIIIMASTLTRRNAEISFKALSLGASDYIPKPESTREQAAAETFHHDLIQKIRSLGAKLRRTVPASPNLPGTGYHTTNPPSAPTPDRPREPLSRLLQAPVAQPPLVRRAFSSHAPRALLIGSSTGGPQALMTLVGEIGAVIDRFPVLITQHMPPTFTTILAEHLARSSHRPAHEAVDGEIVKAGRIYLAPGGRHMRVVRRGTDVAIALDDGPPVNFCGRPSTSVQLRDRCLAGRDYWPSCSPAWVRTGCAAARSSRRRQRVIAQTKLPVWYGNAGRRRQCGDLLCHSAARSDRAETGPVVFRRSFVTPLDYEFLRKLLKERSGLDLSADKQYLVESRLIPLARRTGLPGIPELVARLRGGADRLTSDVVEAMTTNETFFFRDKIPFDHLKEAVLPALVHARASRRALRIWCAASSTGQEPYSIAMCVKEFAGLTGWRVEIVATDLSQEVLEKSKAGIGSQFRCSAARDPDGHRFKQTAMVAAQCRYSQHGSIMIEPVRTFPSEPSMILPHV
jgi:two-component system chemotaxis response regulator CheB